MPPIRTDASTSTSLPPPKLKKGKMKMKNLDEPPERHIFDVFQINPFPPLFGDRVLVQTSDLIVRIPKKQGCEIFVLVPLAFWGFFCVIKRDALLSAPLEGGALNPIQTRVASLLDGFQFQMSLEVRRRAKGGAVGYSFDNPWIPEETWLPTMLQEPVVRRATGWAYVTNGYRPFMSACKRGGVEDYYNDDQIRIALEYFECAARSLNYTPLTFKWPEEGRTGWIPTPPDGEASLAWHFAQPPGSVPSKRQKWREMNGKKIKKKGLWKKLSYMKGDEGYELPPDGGEDEGEGEGEGEEDVDGAPITADDLYNEGSSGLHGGIKDEEDSYIGFADS